MPRNISFALTTPQFIARTKTVTRRLKWLNAKVGDELMGCEKCMGLGRGGQIRRLGLIRLVDVRREDLSRLIHEPEYGREECILEGFPDMSPMAFYTFFCHANGMKQNALVTRLEFEYL